MVPRRLDRGSRAAHSWDMMTGVLNIHSVPGLRLGLIGGDALDGRAQHEAGRLRRYSPLT